jgi:hypothetical protein
MSGTATDLWCMSATDLAGAIRSGQASSREVIEAYLRRIEAVNPGLSAVTVVLGERALEAANAADRAVADGVTVTGLLVDLMSFHKRPDVRNPRRWVTGLGGRAWPGPFACVWHLPEGGLPSIEGRLDPADVTCNVPPGGA